MPQSPPPAAEAADEQQWWRDALYYRQLEKDRYNRPCACLRRALWRLWWWVSNAVCLIGILSLGTPSTQMPVGYSGGTRQQKVSSPLQGSSAAERKRVQAQILDLSTGIRQFGEASRDSFNVLSERCSAQERMLLEQQQAIAALTEKITKMEESSLEQAMSSPPATAVM